MRRKNVGKYELALRVFNLQVIMENMEETERDLQKASCEEEIQALITAYSMLVDSFLAQHALYGYMGINKKFRNKIRRFARKRRLVLRH